MRANVWIDEAASESERDCLRPGVNAELGQDVLDVRGDRLRADDELRRDLALSAAIGEEAEDLALAWAEARVLAPSVPVPVAVRGPVRVRRCATQRPLDAREELAGVEWLREVVVRPEHEAGGAVERVRLARRDTRITGRSPSNAS